MRTYSDEEHEQMRTKAIDDRKESLKKYNPDWFIDSLEFVKWSKTPFDIEHWLELSNRNRDKRLSDAIGEVVGISMGWIDSYGIFVSEGILKEINGSDVKLEINGSELVLKDYRIKWVQRKEKRKIGRKKPIIIPDNKFNFKLIEDTYMIEQYMASDVVWEGCQIKLQVRMLFHTFRIYWSVEYGIFYDGDGKGHFNYIADACGKDRISTRKEAREIAHNFIINASLKDIDSLDEFNKQNIRDSKNKVNKLDYLTKKAGIGCVK
ncbi:hypothetical protein KAU43_05855 [candidate division WOR-3 bacterium]|nr:hypothetical protein [candidate division WOR-3 bacterium]